MNADVCSHDRWFMVEVVERNGDMEYQDKSVLKVCAGESMQRSLEEYHLNWRGGIDSDWEEHYESWDEYYADQTDVSNDCAIWSDNTLIQYPCTLCMLSEEDANQFSQMQRTYGAARVTSEKCIEIAEAYIAQAAEYLAREKNITLLEANEKILATIALPR